MIVHGFSETLPPATLIRAAITLQKTYTSTTVIRKLIESSGRKFEFTDATHGDLFTCISETNHTLEEKKGLSSIEQKLPPTTRLLKKSLFSLSNHVDKTRFR